jgi:hypothetical protein
MSRLNATRRVLLHLVSGLLLAAMITELALHALPVSTGYHFGRVDSDHPIAHGTPRSRYTYSRDWSFHLENSGRLNNFGFRAASDYSPDPRTLSIVGNSYVQADAIEPRAALPALLSARSGVPVDAIGVDGFTLADYLEAARWANVTFGSRILLVLLTTGDLEHSCSVREGEHYLRFDDGAVTMNLAPRPSPSRLKQALNDSMLFRYLYDNLHVDANWSRGWRRGDQGPAIASGAAGAGAAGTRAAGANVPEAGRTPARSLVSRCMDASFESAAAEFLLAGFRDLQIRRAARVVFVLAPGYRREQGYAPGQSRDVDRFAQLAAHQGFGIVSLDAAFGAALASGQRLDFLPIDGHWNYAAQAIAARVIADSLSPLISPDR